jgi:hypothetical protein
MNQILAIITSLLQLIGIVKLTPTPSLTPTLTPTPTPIIAELKVLVGSAKIGNQTLTAPTTVSLPPDQTITTSVQSLAVINEQLGTTTHLGPQTTVTYKGTNHIFQTLGQTFTRFIKVAGIHDEFTLDTPTAVATVRGTKLAMFVSKSQTSKLVVVDHQVELASKNPKLTPIQVLAGSQSEVTTKTQELQTSETKPDFLQNQWLEFNNQLDVAPQSDLTVLFSNTVLVPTPTFTPSPTPLATATPAIPILKGPPGAGLTTSLVQTSRGTFKATVLNIDLSSSKMVTDSLEESNCTTNCKVGTLKEYIDKNGGYAGVHGTYFCPASYPDCASKQNSWDFPIFNSRLKRWIPDNTLSWNGRSVLYVDGGGAQYNQNSSGIGGSMDAGIINFPGLVDSSGNVQIDDNQSGLSDKQKAAGTKFGIGRTDNNHIIVVVAYSATMRDFAEIFKTLGSKGGVNLDSGGTAALYYNGRYIFGPGRAIPNAIVFTKK